MLENQFYRSIWTCGKYDQSSESALFYNLIRGQVFFFEDYSASIVGEILKCKKGEAINYNCILEKTGLPDIKILDFLSILENEGLLCKTKCTPSVISNYRNKTIDERKKDDNRISMFGKINKSAETAYMNRCNSRIVNMVLELTYKCTEKCIHCYNPGAIRNNSELSKRSSFQELTFNDYKGIIDDLCDEGMARVCLTGGDPFSKKCIWEILDYLYSKDVAIEIYTNGQNLLGNVERLSNYFPCVVGVSIYSSISEIHDSITGIIGSFDKSIEVIEQLSTYSIPIELKCCLMQNNLGSYIGVGDLARKYGAMFQIECSIFDSMDGDRCASKYLRLTPSQMEVVLQDPDNPLYVGIETNYGYKELQMNENACSAGNKTFCITPDGNLILCPSFHASIGNLKHSRISNILDNSHELKKWLSTTLFEYEECGKHEYCNYCNICPGLNFAEHGTPLKAGENNCYTAKIRYQLAQRIRNGEIDSTDLYEKLRMISKIKYTKIKKEQHESHFDKNLQL